MQVVKDYLPLVQHMHLKDYDGKDPKLAYYCPLGQGKVDVPAILNLMAGRKISGMVMVEVDNDWKSPYRRLLQQGGRRKSGIFEEDRS